MKQKLPFQRRRWPCKMTPQSLESHFYASFHIRQLIYHKYKRKGKNGGSFFRLLEDFIWGWQKALAHLIFSPFSPFNLQIFFFNHYSLTVTSRVLGRTKSCCHCLSSRMFHLKALQRHGQNPVFYPSGQGFAPHADSKKIHELRSELHEAWKQVSGAAMH